MFFPIVCLVKVRQKVWIWQHGFSEINARTLLLYKKFRKTKVRKFSNRGYLSCCVYVDMELLVIHSCLFKGGMS